MIFKCKLCGRTEGSIAMFLWHFEGDVPYCPSCWKIKNFMRKKELSKND